VKAETRADWVSVAEARETILAAVRPLPPERLPLLRAGGAVLAEELIAPIDLPPWDNSAMDGFAVRSEDVLGATEEEPRELRVIDDIAAGGFPARPVVAGTASRIMTGAPLPEGADGVVRVEHTDGGSGLGTAEARVRVFSDADAGRNRRLRGEELRAGERVLEAGRVLRAAELGVAASFGRSQLRTVRRPTVALLSSGDELVDMDGFSEVLAGRRIVASTAYALAARLAEVGLQARLLGIAADSPKSLREHLLRARGCDVLVTTAGISVGAHDHVRGVLDGMGLQPRFWRVRMKPGSPFAFGSIDGLGGIPWFGLPGNPVSSLVTFELFVLPALLRMAGHRAIFPPVVTARLTEPYPHRPGLTHLVRVRLAEQEIGGTTASLTGAQGSGMLTSMAAADGLMVIAEHRPDAAAGDLLPVILPGGAPLREQAGY
jgi:molybdopterin molybdotransferase